MITVLGGKTCVMHSIYSHRCIGKIKRCDWRGGGSSARAHFECTYDTRACTKSGASLADLPCDGRGPLPPPPRSRFELGRQAAADAAVAAADATAATAVGGPSARRVRDTPTAETADTPCAR